MLYPFLFTPVFMERVWGGRNLERLFNKTLPPDKKIGESWEITDRPDAVSVIANGPLQGQTLRWLMENHAAELLGAAHAKATRFPLLVKILDATETLSLQVHPPAQVAERLGGEPKTEMWYIAKAEPRAEIFAGLKKGTTKAGFERALSTGKVEDCLHRIPTKTGDAIMIPSGRVHAIGAGNVIFEVQQNSDTTYRVFDWNRKGLDGKPRELHIAQSMESIDFNDFKPELAIEDVVGGGSVRFRYLTDDPLFRVNVTEVRRGDLVHLRSQGAQIFGMLAGRLLLKGGGQELSLRAGDFALIPASIERVSLHAEARVQFLQVQF